MRRVLALAIVALLVMTGCASTDAGKKAQAQQGTYQALQLAGKTAIATSAAMNQHCPTGKISVDTCKAWNAFLPHFKFSYGQLVKTWTAAAPTGDLASLSAATAALVGESLTYAYAAGVVPAAK
jgi:hypothetical protein